MSLTLCRRAYVSGLFLLCLAAPFFAPAHTSAQAAPSFKLAFYNIQSARGEPGLAGRPVLFTDNLNCTDPTQPMNAWGVGFVQQHLMDSIGNDPSVVALGLAEAWSCGSPENVRTLLGWKSRTGERNGVTLLARHGFAGPEEWVQLDTSLNPNPADTMWVVRAPVCLDAACTQSINVFAAHWYATGITGQTLEEWNAIVQPSYDRQALGTADFLKRAGGMEPHALIGDLNAWEGTARVCNQDPHNAGLGRLRDANYVDAWPLIHGSAEGFTGMTNRPGCGFPEGYTWKRPDYVWAPAFFLPTAITRFGMVTPGDAAPSDHYGLIATFPMPAATEPAPTEPAPAPAEPAPAPTEPAPAATEPAPTVPAPAAGDVVLHAKAAVIVGSNWQMVSDVTAAGGARVHNPDRGAAKLSAPLASPASYVELTFTAQAGRGYRLWLRGFAERSDWANDSVFVQFSGSLSSSGAAVYRIGTTSGTWVNLEDGSNVGLSGWGWQDNGYGVGVLGPLVYFTDGPQTIRIQAREDGFSIDHVVLSSEKYLTTAPGALENDTTILTATSATTTTTEPAPAPTEPAPAPTEPAPAPAPSEPAPAPQPPPADVVLHAKEAVFVGSNWHLLTDATAAGGARVYNPNRGAAKLNAPLASPGSYVELTFTAQAGRGYRLWLRGIAERNEWANDSVFVQFSGSLSSAGAPVYRIGTTSGTCVNLEDGSSAGLSGWGWQDNGYGVGVLGPLVYFAEGPQTIRIQAREDGLSIDQVVLSSEKYLTAAPGALKNDTTILPATPSITTTTTTTTTEPAPAPASVAEIVLLASQAARFAGTWSVLPDVTAAGGIAVGTPDSGASKANTAAAFPVDYVEFTFDAEAGMPYRLWMRGRAQKDFWKNDSVFVQFSGSVKTTGAAAWRIGTTDSLYVNLEDGANAGLSGWGWQDNGYGVGVLGPLVVFETSGPQTIRLQTREDGFRIDQIVLSADKYLATAPGALKNDTTILR